MSQVKAANSLLNDSEANFFDQITIHSSLYAYDSMVRRNLDSRRDVKIWVLPFREDGKLWVIFVYERELFKIFSIELHFSTYFSDRLVKDLVGLNASGIVAIKEWAFNAILEDKLNSWHCAAIYSFHSNLCQFQRLWQSLRAFKL